MEHPLKISPLGILPSAKPPVRAPFDAPADPDGFVWVKASSRSNAPSEAAADFNPDSCFGDVEGHSLWMVFHDKHIEVRLYEEMHIDVVFRELEATLQTQVSTAEQRPVHLHLAQRDLSVLNMKRIIALFRSVWGSNVTQIYCSSSALRRFAAQQFRCQFHLSDPEVALSDVPEQNAQLPHPSSSLTIQHRILPGAIIRSEGDIIVYGSVPKGAVLEAGGSITILGGLFGEAHAGIMGDEDSFVLALVFGPERIQIAHHRCYTDPMREPCQATRISLNEGQLTVSEYPIL
jgi:septum formation inhibitor MinC